jgi:ElaB/YqjD/DUF883 family membrane-anchored ribosome-binding protein
MRWPSCETERAGFVSRLCSRTRVAMIRPIALLAALGSTVRSAGIELDWFRYPLSEGYAKVPCLFLHGAFTDGPVPGAMRHKHSDIPTALAMSPKDGYWGTFEQQLDDVCSETLFWHANTMHSKGPNDISLQNEYYREAKAVTDRNGVVFCDSLCNPILAYACVQQNKCDVQWYMIAGPLRGLVMPDWIKTQSNNARTMLRPFFFNEVDDTSIDKLLANPTISSMAATARYGRSDPDPATRDQVAKVVADKNLLAGALCGYVPAIDHCLGVAPAQALACGTVSGIMRSAAVLAILPLTRDNGAFATDGWYTSTLPGDIVSMGAKNDGLIDLISCARFRTADGQERWYGHNTGLAGGPAWPVVKHMDEPKDRFVVSNVDHQESTGRWNLASPTILKWMRYRIIYHQRKLSGDSKDYVPRDHKAALNQEMQALVDVTQAKAQAFRNKLKAAPDALRKSAEDAKKKLEQIRSTAKSELNGFKKSLPDGMDVFEEKIKGLVSKWW